MKKILSIFILLIISSQFAAAQGYGFGLGGIIGKPTGITCKGWLTRSSALQFEVGWPSVSSTNSTVLSLEYLWHSHVFRSKEQLPIFYGIGGVMGISSGSNAFGARGIVGIAWWPRNSSLDVFLQLAPTLYFSPSAKFEFDGGIGVRFFF